MAATSVTGLEGRSKDVIALFDVDGTLTEARKVGELLAYNSSNFSRYPNSAQLADPATITFLKALRQKMYIGMVGGSDLSKQREQLGDDGS